MHCSEYVLLGRLAHGILLIIRQENHIFPCITKIAIQVRRHVLDVVDAPSQLTLLTKVVDTDQQSFSSSSTIGVLKVISLGRAMTESLLALRRGRWCLVVSLDVGIRVDGRET